MASLGRYELIETLGQGGMGTIHLAVVGGLGRFRKLVVLKVLRDELTRDDKFVEMFMREAALAACLSHPNVVQTVEAGQADGRYFLVMEFLDGQPFSRLLRGAGREPVLPLALRLHVLCEALLGLHYAHELHGYDGRALHLVHRDVSPPNVFVSYDGQVKLLDFGIANARDGENSHPGEFKGKLGYAAPEQLRGQPADRRIDVFAAGVVLWESIALRQLTQGTPTRETFAARLAGTEPRVAEIVPGVDPALAAICDRAMHTEPEARYATAEDFRAALLTYLTERELLVDGGAVAQFMMSKFASVRAAMHRRIDAHSKEASEREATSSVVSLADLRGGTPASVPSVVSSLLPRAANAAALPPVTSSVVEGRAFFARERSFEERGFSARERSFEERAASALQRRHDASSSTLEAADGELEVESSYAPRAPRRAAGPLLVITGMVLAIAGTAWLARSSRRQATAESSARLSASPHVSATRADGGTGGDAVVELPRGLDPPVRTEAMSSARSRAEEPRASTLRSRAEEPRASTTSPESVTETARTRHRERAATSSASLTRENRSVRSSDRASTVDSGPRPSDPEPPDLRRVLKRERRQLDVDNPFQ